MKRNQATITNTTKWDDQNGSNITFLLEANGFVGVFRIHYQDESRKNAKYSSYRAIQTYFEDVDNRPNAYKTYNVEDAVNAMLFVERKSQWILEFIMREYESIYRKNEIIQTTTDMI